MLNDINSFLEHWEPTWLFLLIAFEGLVGLYSGYILTIEFWYDKAFNDNIKASRKERRRKRYDFQLPEEKLTEGEMK